MPSAIFSCLVAICPFVWQMFNLIAVDEVAPIPPKKQRGVCGKSRKLEGSPDEERGDDHLQTAAELCWDRCLFFGDQMETEGSNNDSCEKIADNERDMDLLLCVL